MPRLSYSCPIGLLGWLSTEPGSLTVIEYAISTAMNLLLLGLIIIVPIILWKKLTDPPNWNTRRGSGAGRGDWGASDPGGGDFGSGASDGGGD